MPDTKAIVNATLDQLRAERRLTEEQLAEQLSVDPVTLWRWRQGNVGLAARILIPIIAKNSAQNNQILT